jgi:monothiol glutaredoxin
MTVSTIEQIKKLISENPVVLFMKGSNLQPRCGFSAKSVDLVSKITTSKGIPLKTVDVLASEEIRQGIKDYSDWPTIPQLYINQEFIGGCDIITELYESGELEKMIQA